MDSEELKTLGSAPIGRRRVLQGVAVGGALWAAPSVLTLDRASAATGSAQVCGPLNCSNEATCASNANCACAALNGGGSACNGLDSDGNNGRCYGPGGGNICNTDADCASQIAGGVIPPEDTVCFQLDPASCSQCGGSTYCGAPCGAAGNSRRRPAAAHQHGGIRVVA